MGSGGVTNLVAKLTLNTKEWGTNIASASNDLKKIQQSVSNASDFISNLGGSLVSGATKFAGWAGAGLAAKEGLEKFMRAGQTTGDFLDRETAKWTGLFDNFFQALNNGDVSGFLAMMGKVREAIDQAHRALDSFQDADESVQALKMQFQLEQRRLLQEIKRNKDNPTLVDENKKRLQQLEAEYRRRLGALAIMKEDVVNSDINSIISTPISSGIKSLGGYWTTNWIKNRSPKTSMQSIRDIMNIEALGMYDAVAEAAKKLAEVLKKATGGKMPKEWSKDVTERIMPLVNAFSSKYGVSLLDFLRWDEVDPDDRKKIREGVRSYYAILGEEYEFAERNTEVFNIGASGGGNKKSATAKVFAPGSIGWIGQEITKLQARQKGATNIYEIQRLQAEIDKLKERQRTIETAIATGKGLQGKIAPLAGGMVKIDAKDAKMPEPITIFEDNQPNVIEDVRVGLGGVADMLGIITGATDDSASAWLNYASKVINAIGSMLPALQALGIGNATSQSAAAGPFGWVQIPVAVAAVVSAFMSAPKFANGGIVPGTSYSGDKVMSYLNSGEMVLNAGQQARLFAMLNGASSAGGGAVEFEIRGDKLVGVLNNYNRRRAKVV